MTWKTFTSAIKKSKLVHGTQAEILISLFKSAGYINKKEDGISISSANKWINGSRNCDAHRYFPDNELVNPKGAYQFFRGRPQDKIENLQQILYKEIDENSPIDCITKDMDRFCWSLVNQFLDLLGFQRIDMPASDLPSDLEFDSNTINNEIGENAVGEQSSDTSQNEIIHQEALPSINCGAQIAIPQECKICLCCKYWRGNTKDAYKNNNNEYGECNAFAKRVLASDGISCDKFKGNYSEIIMYQHYRKMNISL